MAPATSPAPPASRISALPAEAATVLHTWRQAEVDGGWRDLDPWGAPDGTAPCPAAGTSDAPDPARIATFACDVAREDEVKHGFDQVAAGIRLRTVNDPLTVIGVSVFGGPYAEDQEMRRRTR